MKFAATSTVDGTVITCHGRGACAGACACDAVVGIVKNKIGKRKSGTRKYLWAAFIASTPDR
jgi:hypothetical protein